MKMRIFYCLLLLLQITSIVPKDGLSAELLSLDGTVFASSSTAGHAAELAVDDDPATRWSSEYSDDQWIYIDLGAIAIIEEVILDWETAYGEVYEIQVSNDAENWITLYTQEQGSGDLEQITGLNGSGRYVRLKGISRGTRWGYSLYEFEVWGHYATATNLAKNQIAIASSSQDSFTAEQAFDGNLETRWGSSYSDDQWIYVDLGATATISKILLDWETAYAQAYEIQVSDDASEWTTIFSEDNGDGAEDLITDLNAHGRYVRMKGISRGTRWGYSLYEFEVWGIYGSITATATQTEGTINIEDDAGTATETSVERNSNEDDSEKPGLNNTGYLGPLTPSDFQYAKTEGMIIEGLDLQGPIYIKADNVTIRNCRITGGTYGIRSTYGKTGLVIEDTEILQADSAGIVAGNFTARRVYIHDIGADGIKAGSNFIIENSYFTKLGTTSGAHADGIQMVSGSNGIIRGNTFDMVQSDDYANSQCILLKTDSGYIDDITIDSNWINGGGYSIQVRDNSKKPYGFPTNITVSNNIIGRDHQYGSPFKIEGDAVVTGNIWEDTGDLLNNQDESP